MASIAKLVVSLGASTANFQTDMQRAGRISKRELGKMERQAKQLNEKWNRNFKMAGLAVAGGLALATKAAIDFEKSMAEVSTLLDDTSGLEKLTKNVKKLSIEFGQSPVDTAKALYQIISAGASTAAEQMEQLTAANKLAVGGVTDVATAADGLTSVLNAYAGSGMTAQEVSDILFTTMKGGKTTIGELSQSIGQVATIAAQTGVGFNELGAAVATITKSGIKTTEAMSGLRGVLSAVLKQSDQSVKMAKELGVEFSATALQAKGLSKFLGDIADSGATTEQMSKLFGRVEGLTAVLSLGANNAAEFNKQLGEMETAAGATDTAVSKMMETTAFKAAQARQAISVLAIEFGEKLLASVAGASTLIVKNIDKISAVIEGLVLLLTIRLGIAGVAAIVAAGGATTALASAMAILGGPIGAVALGLGALIIAIRAYQNAMDAAMETTEVSGRFLLQNIDYFIALGDAASLAASKIDISAKMDQLKESIARINAQLLTANKQWQIWDSTVGAAHPQTIKLKDAVEALELELLNASNVHAKYFDSLNKITKAHRQAAGQTTFFANSIKSALKLMRDMRRESISLDNAMVGFNKRIAAARKLIDEATKSMEATKQATDEYDRALQSLLNTLFPLEAAGRQLGEDLAMLTREYESGRLSVQRYEEAVRRATDAFSGIQTEAAETVVEFNALTTAMDEGVRILERVFSTLWTDILDGANNLWDNIADGFKSLIANLIHQATTQKIILNIQQGIAGTNPNVPGGGIDFTALRDDLAAFAGVIAGSALGGGGFGATFGAAIGTALGQFLIPIPILGAVVGGIVGGLIGGFIDKIFKKTPRIGAGGFDIAPGDTKFFGTDLGGVFVGDTKGGMDEFVAEFGAAIVEFDKTVAGFLSENQLGAVTDRLESWSKEARGDFATIEEVLRSRFSAILSTFGASINAFVRQGEDLVEQIGRLEVAAKAEALTIEFPDIFGEASIDEFLSIITAFKTGTKTIGDAFNEVVAMLNVIVGVTDFLKDFSASDLGADFQSFLAAQDITLTAALSGMNQGLMEAIFNFDGSVDALQRVGLIAQSVREGELKLLISMDAIQKGINANLDKLKADILGLTAAPKTTSGIISEAAALKQAIQFAETPEELAQLEREFTALIRSISPEDQKLFQSDILALVDQFQTAINAAAETQRQAVIDNAAEARTMVEAFTLRIGTPLDILAENAPQEVEYLRQIAENTKADDTEPEKDIGTQVADAIIEGFGGANVNVTVVINSDAGLVSE